MHLIQINDARCTVFKFQETMLCPTRACSETRSFEKKPLPGFPTPNGSLAKMNECGISIVIYIRMPLLIYKGCRYCQRTTASWNCYSRFKRARTELVWKSEYLVWL